MIIIHRTCYIIGSLLTFTRIRHSSDPLVHHGRHFGRTVYAMCNVRLLITNGLLRLEELDGGEIMEESLTSECVFLLIYSSCWHLLLVL